MVEKPKTEENQERKRRTLDILLTTGVGVGMITNFAVSTTTFMGLGEEIAPRIQEYVGSIGSEVVKYGLPLAASLAATGFGVIAVIATDKYLRNKRYNLEPKS